MQMISIIQVMLEAHSGKQLLVGKVVLTAG